MKKSFLLFLFLVFAISINSQTLIGSWTGKLELGTVQLNLVFNISTNEQGELSCTLDSPDQGAKGIPATVSVADSTKLTITIPALGVTYNGELNDGVISGTFTQQGYSFPLNLKPGKIVHNRPQNPTQPYPYQTEEVTFTNSDDNAVFCGTLTMPVDFEKQPKGTVPVVVMVTGSGQQNRDEEIFDHKPFLVLADYLARNGIASLRYDDRGTGKSTGDVANATTQNNMKDALAGIEYVKNTGLFGKSGVLGHSEGGTIAFMLGAKGAVDFVISLAGCAVRGDSVLIEQNDKLLMYSAVPANLRADYCAALGKVFAAIRNGEGSENAEQTVRNIVAETSIGSMEGAEENLVTVLKTANPWMKFFVTYDPSNDISNTLCPVFALNGSSDIQVLSSTNLDSIRRLLPDNPSNSVKEYKGLNHLFQHCTTGLPTEYPNIEETISQDVLQDIASWINGLE